MKRVYVYCEGQTEETFVNRVLAPYFWIREIVAVPIICQTSRTLEAKRKGGISSYAKVKKEIAALCRQHKNEFVTTMIDYYGMPDNTPGIDCMEPDLQKRIAIIEATINSDIAQPNFVFHFMVHEFEAVLFSKPECFGDVFKNEALTSEVAAIRSAYETPEDINNSRETAPSKRLLQLIPNYRKISHGIQLAEMIGIDVMLKECAHFKSWVECLTSM